LVGIGQQEQGAHADLHDGRLVPGEQQRHGKHGDLVVCGVLVFAQPGDDVVAGLAVLTRDELLAVGEQIAQSLLGAGSVADVGGGLGPGAELQTAT
jgi:hypothetical protein